MSDDTPADIKAYAAGAGITFPIAPNNASHSTIDVANAYGLQGTPENFLLDSTGHLAKHFGGAEEDALRDEIAKLGVK